MKEPAASLWMPYTQMKTAFPPIRVVRTEREFLHLDDGRVLIDGIASWWTAAHGYNHPHLQQAIEEQSRIMPHVMLGGIQHPGAVQLAHRLCQLTDFHEGKVFFSDFRFSRG